MKYNIKKTIQLMSMLKKMMNITTIKMTKKMKMKMIRLINIITI